MLQRTPLPEIFFRLEMTARRKLRLLPAVCVRQAVATDAPFALLSTGEVVAKRVGFHSTVSCSHSSLMLIEIHNRKDWGEWFRYRVSSVQLILSAWFSCYWAHHLYAIVSLWFHFWVVARLQRFELLPGVSLRFQISSVRDSWWKLFAFMLRRSSNLRPWSKLAMSRTCLA